MIEWLALGLAGFAASLSLMLLLWAGSIEQWRRGNPWPERKRPTSRRCCSEHPASNIGCCLDSMSRGRQRG